MDLATFPRRLLLPMLLALLGACWLLGGVTADSTNADEWLVLWSLPLLLCAGWLLLSGGVAGRLQRWSLLAAGMVLVVPLLQLLPLPETLWRLAVARVALGAELSAAGVAAPDLRWTLSPAASEGALWSVMPALAAFLAALALSPWQRSVVVRAVLFVVGGNVLFAFFQAGLPADSTLRLFKGAGSGFGGLLANPNHQATALIIAMVLAVGCAVHARRRDQAGRGHPFAWAAYAGYAIACLLLLPLTTSRAGMSLALPALAAALLLTGAVGWQRSRLPSRRGWVVLAAVVLLAVVGIRAAIGWVAIDQTEEVRHVVAAATLDMAGEELPWGSGMGSFVPVFAQSAPQSLWMDVYINHAHNEFVQWWLEAGVVGMLAVLMALALLALAAVQVIRAAGRDGAAILAASCLVAILAVVAHSLADFPLRTLSLMTTVAMLAGLMLGALAHGEDAAPPAEARSIGH